MRISIQGILDPSQSCWNFSSRPTTTASTEKTSSTPVRPSTTSSTIVKPSTTSTGTSEPILSSSTTETVTEAATTKGNPGEGCKRHRRKREATCSSELSEKCKANGGYCGDPNLCPGTVVPNLCPGGGDNRCCTGMPFQEDECEAAGGVCGDKCACEGEVLHNKCPSQFGSIKCCPKEKEPECEKPGGEECSQLTCPTGLSTSCSNGKCTVSCSGEVMCSGSCSSISTSCSNGDCNLTCRGSGANLTTVGNGCKCEEGGENAESGERKQLSCNEVKGKTGLIGACKKKDSCNSGLFVANKCPGSEYCCIPDPWTCSGDTDLEYEKHLELTEGNSWLEGYIPKAGSGVTVALGYDLGHGPDIKSCLNDPSLWSVLKPFRGLKSVKSLKSAGYKVVSLKNSEVS